MLPARSAHTLPQGRIHAAQRLHRGGKRVSSAAQLFGAEEMRSSGDDGVGVFGLVVVIARAPYFELPADHGADAETPLGRHAFPHEMVEQAAEGVAFVVAAQRIAGKRLPHLLDEHRGEHPLERLGAGMRGLARFGRRAERHGGHKLRQRFRQSDVFYRNPWNVFPPETPGNGVPYPRACSRNPWERRTLSQGLMISHEHQFRVQGAGRLDRLEDGDQIAQRRPQRVRGRASSATVIV